MQIQSMWTKLDIFIIHNLFLSIHLLYYSSNMTPISLFLFAGRTFSDKVDRLKLAEIVKQAIEEKTNLQESQ